MKLSESRRISELRNLGPKLQEYLAKIEIYTEDDLRKAGPIEAFLRMAELSPHLRNRMALYAIYGALTDQDCLRLPQETKDWLEAELQKRGYPPPTSKHKPWRGA